MLEHGSLDELKYKRVKKDINGYTVAEYKFKTETLGSDISKKIDYIFSTYKDRITLKDSFTYFQSLCSEIKYHTLKRILSGTKKEMNDRIDRILSREVSSGFLSTLL